MNALRLSLALLLLAWFSGAQSANPSMADRDCTEILERYARDPSSVPQHLVDECKEKMAMADPDAAPLPEPDIRARIAAVDPCSGQDAAKSVLCWGPWTDLAPAAAAPPVLPSLPDGIDDCGDLSQIADRCVPLLAQVTPVPPLPGCPPGTPCGFATVVDGVTSGSNVPAANTTFASFDLAQDGTSFSVSPDGAPAIASVPNMTPVIVNRVPPDGYQQLFSDGVAGNDQSRLASRVVTANNGDILLAADVWTQANSATLAAKSGYYAWGIGTSQVGLNNLNAGNVSVAFTGQMLVDKATTGTITVNFGSTPGWTGNWTNPAYNFSAGGTLTGADLISVPAQFSANVTGANDFVQGALVGEPGSQGITHIIDVTLAGPGRIKDVGLLRGP